MSKTGLLNADAEVRVLTLGGCNMVLGTDWLRQYNLLFDFKSLKLSFKKDGKHVTLKGLEGIATLKSMSDSALKKLIKKRTHGFCGQFFIISDVQQRTK